MRRLALFLIKVYQASFSPDHGVMKFLYPNGYCRFHPTCSAYSFEAINRFGLIKGLFLSVFRISKCHPWSKGGIDPVPEKE